MSVPTLHSSSPARLAPSQGFILTQQARDVGNGTEITLWLWSAQGPVRVTVRGQTPLFFLPAAALSTARELFVGAGIHGRFRRLALTSFDQTPVVGCYFATLRAFHRAQELLTIRGIAHFEADIRLTERYLMERFITAGVTWSGAPAIRRGTAAPWQVEPARLAPAKVKPDFRWVSLDIECAADSALFSIGLFSPDAAVVLMIGAEEAAASPTTPIMWVADEAALFSALERWFATHDPDLVLGWNVVNFDFKWLIRRAELAKRQLRLGRGLARCTWRANRMDGEGGTVSVPGRLVLDGIETLKSATWQFANYSLDAVASELLGRGKAIDDVAGRASKISALFQSDKGQLAAYNLEDCRLVAEIFAHCKLLDFVVERAHLTGLSLDRIGGSVAAFTHLYLPRLHRSGYIAPNLPADTGLASPGGYVMDSVPGLYQHVLVLDFKSLYPSIIRTFCIDPMGLIEGLRAPEEAIPGFRGGLFSRERHHLPALICELWAARDAAKAGQDQALATAIKIIMNSFYGVLGSNGCRFFDPRLASSITLRGHAIMQQTRQWIEQQGLAVIYGDTDSIFVHLPTAVSGPAADAMGAYLCQEINQRWQAFIQHEFALTSYLELQYETHYRRFLMPTIRGQEKGSKKRYAGLVGEGAAARLVFKGLETVRADWTPLAKAFQTQLFAMVFNDEDPRAYILATVQATRSGQLDSELIYRKRLRQALADYQKNIPPHVRAARLADAQHVRRGLPPRYQHRGTIAYVITLNGPEPLEYQTSALDYEHYIDKQLRPIADAILPFINQSFARICGQQLELFGA
ncbi:MAG: DNA polymerase II [Aeromonas sp.]